MAKVKGKVGSAEFTGVTASALPVLPDGKPVTEFCIFESGVNQSDYGPVVFDEIAAAFVMQNQAEKANPLQFDFNHGMALKYATAEQGKSAGTFDLAVRGGALYAVNCMWTEEAAARITKREYNLFSPFFDFIDSDPDMDGDGIRRPYKLHNVAILNIAGLNGIQQIAAAGSAVNKETSMTPEEITRLQSRNVALETENAELRASAQEVAVISGTLALAGKSGPAERSQAITGLLALRGEVRRITGKDTDEGAIGVLHTLKTEATGAVELRGKLDEIETNAAKKELDHVFEMGAKAGSIAATPAARKKFEDGPMASMMKLTGGKITPDIIELAKERIEMAGKVNVAPTPQKDPSAGAGTLPAALAAITGVKAESVQKAYERQQARKAGTGAA